MDAAAAPSPWRTIWFSPRRTIRALLEAEVRPSWIPVIVLVAVNQVLASVVPNMSEGGFSAGTVAMGVILGVAQLIFGVLIGPFLLAFAGGWLGGEADPSEIRLSVVWSSVPLAVAAFFWIPALVASPELSAADAESLSMSQLMAGLLLLLFGVVYFVSVVWTVVLQVITLAEVQRFSILRSIASYVILFVPLALLAMLA